MAEVRRPSTNGRHPPDPGATRKPATGADVIPLRQDDAAAWPLIIDALLEAVWIVDAERLCIVRANAAAGTLLGLSPDALRGRDVQTLAATPEDHLFWSDVASGIHEPILSDTYLRRFDGSLVPVTRRVSHVRTGGPQGSFLVAMTDLSAQRRADDEREQLLSELRATLESTADGILVTDLAGHVRAFNKRFSTLWSLPEDMLLQRDDSALQLWMRRSVVDAAAYAQRLSSIEDATLLQTSDVITLHDGRVLERVTMPQWSRGRPIGRVWSFRDITERLAASQRIEQLSHTDPLTGLPNRQMLATRFDYALALAKREGVPFATLVLDLDRFKHLNDTFGQQFGDRVLIEVAERLRDCLRQVDTVARLGGDQYVVLVHGADARGAEGTAQRLIDALLRPFSLDGMSFTVTCSIGIALHPLDGATMDELISHADGAMRRVKEAGRANFRFHQPRKDVDMRARLHLDHAMRLGLERGAFRLHYQPQVDLATGDVIGAEALLRWTDPDLGPVSPAHFIPVAEESGFIIRIGDWVLAEAVQQAAAWHARGLSIPVSINVSALQFQQHSFVSRVATALRSVGLPPELLELELTESILLADADDAMSRLVALADLGVRLAIDDFGTGYSSLGYLKRFPLQRLKIDRSFVSDLPDDESDAAIVHAIINLARALKLKVVAEGVETEAQRRYLQDAGCDQFQGFLYGGAVPNLEFERRLRQSRGQDVVEPRSADGAAES